MRDFQLEFSPFSFVNLHEGAVHKQVNAHSTAHIKGVIAQDKVDEYLDLSTRDRHLPFIIKAVAGDGEELTVFQGVITCAEIDHVGGVATMTIEAKSGSYLMDIEERFRSFQNPWVSHAEILDLLGEPYDDYNFILKTLGSKEGVDVDAEDYDLPENDLSEQLANLMPADGAELSADGADRISGLLLENISERLSSLLPTNKGEQIGGSLLAGQVAARANSLPKGSADVRPISRGEQLSNLSPANMGSLISCMDRSLQSMNRTGQLSNLSPANKNALLSGVDRTLQAAESGNQLPRLSQADRGTLLSGMDSSLQSMSRVGQLSSLTSGKAALLSGAGGMKQQSDLLSAGTASKFAADKIERKLEAIEDAAAMMQKAEDDALIIQDTPIGQFTVQYWETDWAFAKRLASRKNTFLVPADGHPGIRYYFGVPHLHGHIWDDSLDYKTIKDYTFHDEKIRQGLKDVNEADAILYVVEHREIYAVGDVVQFQGMQLCIDRIITAFSGQELVHTYYLRHKKGLRTAMQYNERIIGASLDAQVIAVQRDEVQVQIIDDENAAQAILQWFPFATVYSSPDGTGWYAMPEPGDSVRLYIPDKEEACAVVFNAVHEASEARSNPDIKSMRNKFGKEIRFTPNTLVMTNNAGMEISIIDGEGIRIESNKNIFVKADGNIDISCAAGLSMLASDSVVVEQGGTCLVVDDDVSFVGGKLRMQ